MQFFSRDRLNIKNLLACIGLITVVVLFYSAYLNFMKESRAKYPITILQTVLDGEYSFQKEYGKFTDKLEDAGFFGSGTDIEVYITKDNLPYDLAEKIGIENAPYFNESEFRFIFLFKKMKDNQDNMIWMLNNKGQKKMLYKY